MEMNLVVMVRIIIMEIINIKIQTKINNKDRGTAPRSFYVLIFRKIHRWLIHYQLWVELFLYHAGIFCKTNV